MSRLQSRWSFSTYVAELAAGATGVRNARHLTLEEGDHGISDWTPDSQTAIIMRNAGDHSEVYRQSLSSDVAEPIVARIDAGLLEDARLSSDARWLILQVWPLPPPPNLAPRKQIWRVPISGGPLQQLFSLAPGSYFSCARAPVNLCVTGEPTADRRKVVVSAFDSGTGQRGRELLRYDRYPYPDEDF